MLEIRIVLSITIPKCDPTHLAKQDLHLSILRGLRESQLKSFSDLLDYSRSTI
jgi:hypothetical protein